MEKKHKLIIIDPSGREHKLGFLSPCGNGFVLGTVEVEEADTSHLTVLSKGGKLSSHITPKKHRSDRRYFRPMSMKEISEAVQRIVNENLISPLTGEHLSEQVFYITQKFINLYKSLKAILYEKKTLPREVIHIFNFKRAVEKMPEFTDEIKCLKENPSSFLGLCQAREILEDDSKIFGFTNTKSIVIPFENELFLLDFSLISNFIPTSSQEEISTPLSEIYRCMGIPQYMQEIQEKKIIEKLLSKETSNLHIHPNSNPKL